MSDEIITQVLKDAGITPRTPGLKRFPLAGKASVIPAGFNVGGCPGHNNGNGSR
jgi:hypothetical protein